MSLIESFLTNTYTVRRSSGATVVNGRWEESGFTTVVVKGSLQPLNAREIKMLPEGFRLKQMYKLYSDASIATINTASQAGADKVTIDGETFKVISVEDWKGTKVDLPHFKSILQREPQQ